MRVWQIEVGLADSFYDFSIRVLADRVTVEDIVGAESRTATIYRGREKVTLHFCYVSSLTLKEGT